MENQINEKKVRRNNKRKNTKLKKMIIVLLALLFILILIDRIGEKTISKTELTLIVENEDITKELKDGIIKQNDTIYLSFDDVKKVFDKNIYIEDNTSLIITTGDKKVAGLKIGETKTQINDAEIEMQVAAFKTEKGKIYLPLFELKNVYDMEVAFIPETNNIVIDYFSKELKKADVDKSSNVKNSTSNLSKTIDKVKKGEAVVFISKKNGWAKIRTNSGMIGYLKDKSINNIRTERENIDESNVPENSKSLEKNLNEVDLDTFEERKKLINNIIAEAIKDKYKVVKVSYEAKNSEGYERFKIESKPMLKECGLYIIFE